MRPDSGRGLRGLLWYRVLSRLYFHLSVLFVLLLTSGQGVVAVEVELAVYGVAIVAAGPVATAARRFVDGPVILVGGEIVKATGLALLACGPGSPPIAVTAQVLNGFGFGLTSMTDPVVVSAALDGDAGKIGRFQASAQSLMFLATLVAGVTGAVLFEWHPTAPLWCSVVATVSGAVTAARTSRGSPAARRRATIRVHGRRPSRRQVRVAAYYVIARGFMLAAFVGVLPFLLYRSEHVGVVGLSLALGAFSVAAFVTARTSQQLLRIAGEVRVLAGSSLLLTGAFVCLAFTRDVAVTIAAMTVMGGGSGTVRPATMRLLGEISTASPELPGLAIVARHMESAFGLVNAVVMVASGVLIVHTSFRAGMLVLTATFCTALVASLVLTGGRRRGSTVDQMLSQPV